MGVTSKMTRMVLLCILILSMVSLPTSLARKECTDFLEEASMQAGNAYKTMGPALLDGMNAVMEKSNKGEDYGRLTAPRPHPPRPRPSPSPNPWWGGWGRGGSGNIVGR